MKTIIRDIILTGSILFSTLVYGQTYQLVKEDGYEYKSLIQIIADYEYNIIHIYFEENADSLKFELIEMKITEKGIYYFLYSEISDNCLTMYYYNKSRDIRLSMAGMVINYKFISDQSIIELRQTGY